MEDDNGILCALSQTRSHCEEKKHISKKLNFAGVEKSSKWSADSLTRFQSVDYKVELSTHVLNRLKPVAHWPTWPPMQVASNNERTSAISKTTREFFQNPNISIRFFFFCIVNMQTRFFVKLDYPNIQHLCRNVQHDPMSLLFGTEGVF